MKRPIRRFFIATAQQGYTLLEVFFAILLVSGVLLGLSGMTAMVMQSNSTNDLVDTAVDLAQDKLEEMKNALFTSTALADLNSSNNGNLESVSNFDYRETNINQLGQPGGIFTRTWNIADNAPKAGMKTAVVIVTWMDRLGNHEVFFRTIL